jgi:hypothetical protein
LASRLAVPGGCRPSAAAAWRGRPDVPGRGRRLGPGALLARDPYAAGPGDPPRGPVVRRRRGARSGLGAGRGLGTRLAAGAARRRGRPVRLRAPAPGAGRGAAAPPALAVRPQRSGDGGAGPLDHRAEGHRAGGVQRLPAPRDGLWRAGSWAGGRAAPASTAGAGDPPGHPVVGLAALPHRPGALTTDRAGRPRRRLPGAVPRRRGRGGRPPAADAARSRRVDLRGGSAARPR